VRRPLRLPRRVEPVHGQRLAAVDLRDLLALADHQRRRHVRALHATWGIALGLEVGSVRLRGLGAGPGVAFDSCGRMLVLAARVAIPEPDTLKAPRLLALRGDTCAAEPAASLRLVEADELELGVDVPLARLDPGLPDPDLSVRRYARRAAPAKVAAGRARRGTAVAQGTPHDWSISIDTAEAGFDETPAYLASVGPASASFGGAAAGVEVFDERPNGFKARVRRPGTGGTLDRTSLTTNPEDFSWIAVLAQRPAGVLDPPRPTGPCANDPEELSR
jgi:hypothetical protein